MTKFTSPLTVTKLRKKLWVVKESFQFYSGEKEDGKVIVVPEGFVTDFASIPRLFWIILTPDGQYTQAAVLHDYLYSVRGKVKNPGSDEIIVFSRKDCDDIFLEGMQVLGVPFWKRSVMHRAVRMFGWIPWNKKEK